MNAALKDPNVIDSGKKFSWKLSDNIILVRSLKAANLSLSTSLNLINQENTPLKVANPKHKLHVIINTEFKCDSFS